MSLGEDWYNASEDTAVERWRKIVNFECFNDKQKKECADCYDKISRWLVDNKERFGGNFGTYDAEAFDWIIFPIIHQIVYIGGFKDSFDSQKIFEVWEKNYYSNRKRFEQVLNDICFDVVSELAMHPFVDLGLPSGTKWATMNIGAQKETDFGLYFAWGETQGYSGKLEDRWFDWEQYKFGVESNRTKYNAVDGLTTLESSDDAASVNWGGKWHMPTFEQIEELRDRHNCFGVWVNDYNKSGVNGILFTSERNGNKLFIPAGGNFLCCGGSGKIGEFGFIWSSTLQSDDDKFAARSLRICPGGIDKNCNLRCVGIPIRPVFD